MTIARIATFAFSGIEAVPVEVQVQIAPGLPAFLVVGLPDKAVGESRERVRAALTGLGLSLPPKRVLVNLAPADIAQGGRHFDLPIALARAGRDGHAAAGGRWPATRRSANCRSTGRSCRWPACCRRRSARRGARPRADLPGGAGRRGGLGRAESRCWPRPTSWRWSTTSAAPRCCRPPAAAGAGRRRARGPCLSEVKGQESAKRALEIAAAGGAQPADGRPAGRRQVDAGGAPAGPAAGPDAGRGAGGLAWCIPSPACCRADGW